MESVGVLKCINGDDVEASSRSSQALCAEVDPTVSAGTRALFGELRPSEESVGTELGGPVPDSDARSSDSGTSDEDSDDRSDSDSDTAIFIDD